MILPRALAGVPGQAQSSQQLSKPSLSTTPVPARHILVPRAALSRLHASKGHVTGTQARAEGCAAGQGHWQALALCRQILSKAWGAGCGIMAMGPEEGAHPCLRSRTLGCWEGGPCCE